MRLTCSSCGALNRDYDTSLGDFEWKCSACSAINKYTAPKPKMTKNPYIERLTDETTFNEEKEDEET